MESEANSPLEQSIKTVARSLFGFTFLALITAFITLAALILSPVPPDPGFAQIRNYILIGYGVFFLLVVAVNVVVFRRSEEGLITTARPITRLLRNGWLIFPLIFFAVEINFFAFLILGDVAPSITGPGKFLLLTWSLILALMAVTANLERLSGWFSKTQPLWVGVGVSLMVLIVFFALNLVNQRIVAATRIEDRLRGYLDYRPLIFFNEGENPARTREFWTENSEMKAQWLPYTYWTLEPYEGQHINIDGLGLRRTATFVEPDDTEATNIYFFGGSTAWGEGARDDYTIPSHMARILHEEGYHARVVNYGQTGYVGTQDMIIFELQLALDNVPDVAVFYQGFNDMLSAYEQGMSGLPYYENHRISDFYAGRLLKDGQLVLIPPPATIEDFDYSPVALEGGGAEEIVARYLANVRIIRAIAAEYGVDVIFVWQPALFYKDTLTGAEPSIRAEVDVITPGFAELYSEANNILRLRIADENIEDIVVISDLFTDDGREIFHDRVHVNEEGNFTIAEAIMPALYDVLSQ